MVFDKSPEIKKVSIAPRIMTAVRISVPRKELAAKKPIRAMSAGNLPLQGINTFVRIAISRSRGESIILHPVIPAALQPSPIAIVRDCFPLASALLKKRSRLNAALGR